MRIVRTLLKWCAVAVALALSAAVGFRFLPEDIRGHRLLNAARVGSIPRVHLFVSLGSDVNFATGDGTALHIAAMRGDIPLMEYLLRHGADPDFGAKWSRTPLYHARTYSHPEAERLLLARGANPDTSHINPP